MGSQQLQHGASAPETRARQHAGMSSSRSCRLRLLFNLLAAASLLSCAAAALSLRAEAAPAASAAGAAITPAAELRPFLQQHYGAYDARRQAWPGRAADAGPPRRYTVCADRLLPGGTQRLLAVCGAIEGAAAHVESARLDLYQLRQQAGQWQIELQLTGLETGNFGEPGELRTLQLGAGWYGFAVLDGYTGQGQTIDSLHLYAPTKRGLAEVLALNVGYENSGLPEGEDGKPRAATCRQIERRWRLDASQPAAAAYPLRIDETQQIGAARQPRHLQHALTFDATAGRYRLPPTLQPWLE